MTPLPMHPAAALLPMLGESELAALVADIAEHGQRHAIVLLDGQVLDGRNRLLACERAGIEPRFETLPECASPTAYVLSANLHRRHLDEGQRAMVGAKATALFKDEARARQLGGLKRGAVAPEPASADSRSRGKASEMAAEQTGASPRSIESALRVQRDGVPELVAAVERGEVSVSAAEAVADLPHEEQRVVVAEGKAKDVARAKRAKPVAPTPIPSTPRAAIPEPPDACAKPDCDSRSFRDGSEPDHEGKPIVRWVCTKCGLVAKPTAKPSPPATVIEAHEAFAASFTPQAPLVISTEEAERRQLMAQIGGLLETMTTKGLRATLEAAKAQKTRSTK